jgi:hypothetical protein
MVNPGVGPEARCSSLSRSPSVTRREEPTSSGAAPRRKPRRRSLFVLGGWGSGDVDRGSGDVDRGSGDRIGIGRSGDRGIGRSLTGTRLIRWRGLGSAGGGANEFAATTTRSPRVLYPFCYLRLKAEIPRRRSMPERIVTLSDHLRKRRAELDWSQRRTDREMAWGDKLTWTWEKDVPPRARNWDKIIVFLGYDPRPLPTDMAAD